MNSKWKIPVIILTAASAFTQDAAAQQSTKATPESAIDLDQITVTATRSPQQVLDVPATVSVITRQEIEDHGIRDMQDLVRYQPGVSVNRQTSGTDPFGNFGGFTIRGVGGNRVQMRVDGVRVIERITDGTRDFVGMPFMKSVEILRGPGTVLWGADALGGIVSYRTLDPSDLLRDPTKSYGGKLDTAFDSFDRSFVKTAITAVRINPSLEALVGISHRSNNEARLSQARADGGIYGCPVPSLRYLPCNQLNPVSQSTLNGFAKLVYRPTTDHELKLSGEWYDRDGTVNQIYDYNVVSLGIRNGPYLRNQVMTRKTISLEHEWNVGAPYLDSLRWQVSHSAQQRQFISDRVQQLANGQLRYTHGYLSYLEKFTQLDIQAKSTFVLGPSRHKLTYGFQGDLMQADYNRRDDIRNLTTNVLTTTIAGGFNFANSTTKRYDFFLQDEIELFSDRWTVTPGIRYANYEINPKPGPGYVYIPGRQPRDLAAHRFVPQLSTMFKLNDTYSVYARYSEGFKMPTAQQLFTSLPFGNQNLIPNPDLRPEQAQSYEAGIRGKFAQGWFSIGVFHTRYKDFIQELYQINATELTSRNLSSVTISGVEASAEWRFHERWLANLSVSYQYGNQRATPGAVQTAYSDISPLTAVTGLKYQMPEHGLEAEFIGTFAAGVARAATPTTFKPPGYSVFDAYLNWKPLPNVTLRAGIQNMFDRRYFSNVFRYDIAPSASVRAVNPLELQTAPGRTFKIGATIDF
ncbi:MAG: hypothetical protein BGP04_02555 [Rhizobiales bacterium 62-17]|nr:MAG: hypothetical protein BGP04_02555 [Rhizobiales bacterium 62-17]